jgi:ferredoxin
MGATDPPPTQNAEGRYAITEECDGCGLCVSYSAYSFAASADAARYFVIRQPVDGSEEEALLRDAMDQCPLGCIRDDGPAT